MLFPFRNGGDSQNRLLGFLDPRLGQFGRHLDAILLIPNVSEHTAVAEILDLIPSTIIYSFGESGTYSAYLDLSQSGYDINPVAVGDTLQLDNAVFLKLVAAGPGTTQLDLVYDAMTLRILSGDFPNDTTCQENILLIESTESKDPLICQPQILLTRTKIPNPSFRLDEVNGITIYTDGREAWMEKY